MMMPEKDGWQVLDELQADPNLRDVPVILVSILGEDELACASGAVASLQKPVNREALLAAVQRHVKGGRGRRALVVDDDALTRTLHRELLEAEGWEVVEASDGQAALERVEQARPDLVLLDLLMPGLDGFGFLLQFRQLPDCSETPVLVVTAKDLDDAERSRLAGTTEAVLEKTGRTRELLLEEVRRLLPAASQRSGST